MDKNTTVGMASTIFHSKSMVPFMSDKNFSLLLPIIIYWIYSGLYHLISIFKIPFFEKYRIRSTEAEKMNKVSMGEVLKSVILQQIIQTVLGLIVLITEDEDVLLDDTVEMQHISQTLKTFSTKYNAWQIIEPYQDIITESIYWYIIPASKFLLAMIILDTWQYFLHRLFHQNKFLYRHIHSLHHRLYVPYAFGALYNHPIEGLLFDSLGACLAFNFSGMTIRGGVVFFAFSSLKTVDDHSGYKFPFNPIQRIFGNNTAYHDIHHQPHGMKVNFSQPFFTFWDRVLGTYMPTDENHQNHQNHIKIVKESTINDISNNISNDTSSIDNNNQAFKKEEIVNPEVLSPGRYNLRSRENLS